MFGGKFMVFYNVKIFGIPLYEIFLIIGIYLALYLAIFLCNKKGFSQQLKRLLIVDFLITIGVGFLGAMFFQTIYDYIKTGEFNLFQSGMTFYGGFIFGGITFILVWFLGGKILRIETETKENFFDIVEISACAIPLAHAFGRIGCLFAGCCYGKNTDAWFGVLTYTQESVGLVKVVPVQLFESIFLFTLFSCLVTLFLKKKKIPLMAIYLIVYGLWRFCIEYVRADDRGNTIVSFLSPSQLTAIFMIILGAIYWFFIIKIRKKPCGI